MNNIQAVNRRIDKLEIAFVLLLNCLRATKKVEEDFVILKIPEKTLDSLEKMILARIGDGNQLGEIK